MTILAFLLWLLLDCPLGADWCEPDTFSPESI